MISEAIPGTIPASAQVAQVMSIPNVFRAISAINTLETIAVINMADVTQLEKHEQMRRKEPIRLAVGPG